MFLRSTASRALHRKPLARTYIGIQELREASKGPLGSYYLLESDYLNKQHFSEMCAFFNAVEISHPPPFLDLEKENYYGEVADNEKSNLSRVYKQIALSEKSWEQEGDRVIESVPRSILLNLAEVHGVSAIQEVWSTRDAPAAEYALQFGATFAINSDHSDCIYSSTVPFPQFLPDFTPTPQQEDNLNTALASLKSEFSAGMFPPFARFDTRRAYRHNQTMPAIMSPFRSESNVFPYPFLVIDTHRSNQSQLLAFLYSTLASQERYRPLNRPASIIGVCTNGFKFDFVVFQLNSLLLNEGSRNIVWNWSERILPEMRQPEMVLNLDPYLTLRRAFEIGVIEAKKALEEQNREEENQ